MSDERKEQLEWAQACLRTYGPNKKFSSFKDLPHRARFPRSVHAWLEEAHGISGMAWFLTMNLPEAMEKLNLQGIYGGHRGYRYDRNSIATAFTITLQDTVTAAELWREARHDVLGLQPPTPEWEQPQEDEDMTADIKVNADRNEMIALLQGAKGAKFVKVTMQNSRLEDAQSDTKPIKYAGLTLTYKAIGINLKRGDLVIVQYRDRFGIGRVVEVLADTPTSDEYDYSMPLRHVISKLDVTRSEQLLALDKSLLQKITASEANDRLERLTRQLGMTMDSITLELPPVDPVVE